MSRKSLYSSRTKPSVFFGLPDPLKVCILDDWLELPNIPCMMDNESDLVGAVQPCSLLRADLARLFRSDCIFRCKIKGRSFKHLQWLLANQIRISNIEMERAAIEEDVSRDKILAHLAPTLQRLELNISSSWVNNGSRDSEFSYEALNHYGDYEGDDEQHGADGGENRLQKATLQTKLILSDLFASLTLLKHFHLRGNVFDIPIDLPDTFSELFTQCVHLESISLQSFIISAPIIAALCKAPNLRQVDLLGSTTMTYKGLLPASESPVRQVRTTSAAFCALFPLLEDVTLTHNTSGDVLTLARACMCMKKATVTLTTPIDATLAHQISQHWGQISFLTFISVTKDEKLPITEGAAAAFITECPSLRYFYTGHALGPTSSCAIAPPCVYPIRYEGSQLKQLHIRVNWTSDKFLQTVVKTCPYLHTLHLSGVVPNGLSSLHLLNDTSVKHLHLQACNNVTDFDIARLRNIETLHIGDIRSTSGSMLSCSGVVHFAKNCPTLRALHFYDVKPDLAMCVLDVVPVRPSLQAFTFEFGSSSSYDATSAVLVTMLQRMVTERFPGVKILFTKKEYKYGYY